jgi:membrane protein implicated in regulation of membrane protease activity
MSAIPTADIPIMIRIVLMPLMAVSPIMVAVTAVALVPAVIIVIPLVMAVAVVVAVAVALRHCKGRGESQTQQGNGAGSHSRIKKHEDLPLVEASAYRAMGSAQSYQRSPGNDHQLYNH